MPRVHRACRSGQQEFGARVRGCLASGATGRCSGYLHPRGASALILRKIFSLPLSKLGWKRLLLVLLVSAVVIGLLLARPWRSFPPECLLTVRPGESIQAAIDAAEAGAVICLGRGVWTESIAIDKPLTLRGMGVERTTIEAAHVFTPVVEVSGEDTEPMSVKLEGLTISGVGGGSTVAIGGLAAVEIKDCDISGRWYGIRVADAAHLTLRDSTISENKQRGVVLVGAARAAISGCHISGNLGAGVWLSGSAEATFLDCEISGNRGHGLWLQHQARVQLSNCSVSENRGHGLQLEDQSTAQLLGSDISHNWDQGIRAEDSAKVELTESDVLSNWNGIELRNGAQGTIVASAVSGNRWDGIRIQNSSRTIISGSIISANRRGVGIEGEASAEIRDCRIEQNSGYGIFSRSSQEVAGEGNHLRENGIDLGGNVAGTLRVPLKEPVEAAIIWPDDRYTSLQEAVDALLPGGELLLGPGNYTAGLTIGKELAIKAGDGQAMLIAKSDALPVLSLVDGADLYLTGTTISGGAEGLLISAGARAVLVACTISENTEGINLSYSSWLEMAACNVTGNERSGAFIGGAGQATITSCSISNNNGYGIAVADFAQVTITDSVVTRSGGDGGIILWGSCQAVLEGNQVIDNRGFGVAIFQRPCFMASPWGFQGRISGKSNVVADNLRGDMCPPELGFLSTAEGGELDLRLSVSY